MRTYLYHLWNWVFLLLALSACSAEDEIGGGKDPSGEAKGNVYVRLSVGVAGASHLRATDVAETPGTEAENKIHSFYLLVFDEGKSALVWSGKIEGLEPGTSKTFLIDNVLVGKTYHFYGIANLTSAQYKAITQSNDPLRYVMAAKGSDQYNYTSVINTFVPGSNGDAESVANGILMSSEGTPKAIRPEAYENGTEREPFQIEINLRRAVAKVHVLAKPTASESDYIKTYKGEGNNSTSGMGFIRLENVHYFMNGTNRSLYPFAVTKDNKPIDPNMSWDRYISGNDFNEAACAEDFIHYDRRTLAELEPEKMTNNGMNGFRFHKVGTYDDSRYQATVNNSSADNRYTKGLYTPENLFDAPAQLGDNIKKVLDAYPLALPMVSSVAIAARLAPRKVIIPGDFVTNIGEDMTTFEKEGKVPVSESSTMYKPYETEDLARWEEMKDRYDFETPCDWDKLSSAATGAKEGETTPAFCEVDFGKLKDGQTATDRDKEWDIRFVLTLALKYNNMYSAEGYTATTYPSGSFWVYYDEKNQNEGYRYMTCDVALSEALKGERLNILPHIGGWGYYYAYIENTDNTSNSTDPHVYANSPVRRNTYYLLTINLIATPGSTVTSNDYIRVNMRSLEWIYKGKGTLVLE